MVELHELHSINFQFLYILIFLFYKFDTTSFDNSLLHEYRIVHFSIALFMMLYSHCFQ